MRIHIVSNAQYRGNVPASPEGLVTMEPALHAHRSCAKDGVAGGETITPASLLNCHQGQILFDGHVAAADAWHSWRAA